MGERMSGEGGVAKQGGVCPGREDAREGVLFSDFMPYALYHGLYIDARLDAKGVWSVGYSTVRYAALWYRSDVVWYIYIRCSILLHGAVWYSMVWYHTAGRSTSSCDVEYRKLGAGQRRERCSIVFLFLQAEVVRSLRLLSLLHLVRTAFGALSEGGLPSGGASDGGGGGGGGRELNVAVSTKTPMRQTLTLRRKRLTAHCRQAKQAAAILPYLKGLPACLVFRVSNDRCMLF